MLNPNGPPTLRPSAYAPRAMVSTPHQLATSAGLRALSRGGSAVDAVIAANAVLCVTYPHMVGLGGDGFWLIHDPSKGGVRGISAAGPAARAATRQLYLDRGHEKSPPQRGAEAALTVPGSVDGWRLAHEAHGRLGWRSLFDDAIRYAREGIAVGRSLEEWLAADETLLWQDERARATFLRDGRALREGDRLVMRDLAATFERLAEHGPRAGFYEGETARLVVDALAPQGSPLAERDFADFRAEWVAPISTSYRGRTVYEFPPPTQGFAALMVLNLVEAYDLGAWRDGSADYYHHMAEAVKLAFADRDEWLTDPRFVDIPLDRLLSKAYAEERRALVRDDRAMDMDDVSPGIPFRAASREARAAARSDGGGDTCYLCAVDEDGLVVSAIESIFHDFGAGVVGGASGIVMQNRGASFSLDATRANRLEPGKRTSHTLTPGMVLEDDAPALAFGTMGGEGQPQTHVAMLTRIYDFGYGVQQAIEAPRWLMGRTWGERVDDLSLEGRIPDPVARELKRRGQPVKMMRDYDPAMGHAQAIRIHRGARLLEGGADPRGDGAAAGF